MVISGSSESVVVPSEDRCACQIIDAIKEDICPSTARISSPKLSLLLANALVTAFTSFYRLGAGISRAASNCGGSSITGPNSDFLC